jgi:hypothetical protein
VIAAAILVIASVPATGDAIESGDGTDTVPANRSDELGFLLRSPDEINQELPTDPHGALIDVTETFSEELGFVQNTTDDVLTSGISNETAGRVAILLEDMMECHEITQAHLDDLPQNESELRHVAYTGEGLEAENFTDIQQCAKDVHISTEELAIHMEQSDPWGSCLTPPTRLDIWPVVSVGLADCDDTHTHDYALITDPRGDDTYDNNIGSNMLDLRYGPHNSVAPNVGEAKGCQMAIPGLVNGNCTPSVGVLLDSRGSDQFGIKETPDVDARCTDDRVHRRMVTGGVGFLGVGILRDTGSWSHVDSYVGKTGSLGSGHIYGVGLLRDAGGNDHYHSVRNSQGFGLVGGAGILHDEGGQDTYDYYLPDPLDPNATNEEDGAGGVIDDEGLCDNRLRYLQGGGNVGGPTLGLLLDESGDDSYRGGFSANFSAPAPLVTTGRAGSQGFGNNGGAGVLADHGGDDTYNITEQIGEVGEPQRDDNTTILPGEESTGPLGLFHDTER